MDQIAPAAQPNPDVRRDSIVAAIGVCDTYAGEQRAECDKILKWQGLVFLFAVICVILFVVFFLIIPLPSKESGRKLEVVTSQEGDTVHKQSSSTAPKTETGPGSTPPKGAAGTKALQAKNTTLETTPTVPETSGLGTSTDLSTADPDNALANTMIIALAAAYSVTFTILMGMYRFFHGEIARVQQVKIAFYRVLAAGENTSSGFQSEVRKSLTQQAFAVPETGRTRRGRQATHPMLEHPAFEPLSAIFEKFLDELEIKVVVKNDRPDE